ncbi:MAG: hypothetical protein KDD84_17780, partial [Caldilineaceae bacterium]|nr:hypothetical protein [Caldilineaceae bacterium]
MSTLRTTLLLIAASLALVLGADAALAQTPTPTPSPTPAPPLWQSIDLGVVGGNAYSPQSVTVDPARGLAYVFSGRVPEVDGRAANAVTVVRLRDGRIVRRGIVDLGGENSTSGRIWISRDGRRGLLLDNTANQLYHYNPANDDIKAALTDVRSFTVSPNERNVIVRHTDSLVTYSPDLRTRRWRVFDRAQHMAASNDAVLIQSGYDQGEGLALLNLADGTTLAAAQDPGWIDDLVLGPGNTWFVAVSEDGSTIRHLGSDLVEIARADGLTGQELFYDAERAQLLVTGYRYVGITNEPEYWLWSLDTADLTVQKQHRWNDWSMPRSFAVAGDRLAGIYTYDENDRFYVLDADTLAVDHTTVLGVRLTQTIADSATQRLYVADNQDRVHVIDAVTGEILAQWTGSAPLALDSANAVLYVNRYDDFQQIVVGLDADSGDVVASFAGGGVPAPDPNRDLVYIVDDGVYVYNRAGDLLGRLESTFPDPAGFSPNPYAVNAVVNPLSGALIVVKNNGVPGSNNRNFAVVFAPPAEESTLPADEPQIVDSSESVSRRVIFAADSGDAFLTTYGLGGATAVIRLDALGNRVDDVGGRTGILFYYPPEQALFVQERDVLAQFDADLDLVDLRLTPIDLDLAALDEVSGEFYYQATWMGPMLVHINLERVAHLTWGNPGSYTLPQLGDSRTGNLTVIDTGIDT